MSEKKKLYQRARAGTIVAMSIVIGIGFGVITTELLAKSNPNEPMPALDLNAIVIALLGIVSMIVLITYFMEKADYSHHAT